MGGDEPSEDHSVGVNDMIERQCEDCGEPATRMTADGIWLCDGDYDLLCEQYAALQEEPGDE